jgi:hypothetical protein
MGFFLQQKRSKLSCEILDFFLVSNEQFQLFYGLDSQNENFSTKKIKSARLSDVLLKRKGGQSWSRVCMSNRISFSKLLRPFLNRTKHESSHLLDPDDQYLPIFHIFGYLKTLHAHK